MRLEDFFDKFELFAEAPGAVGKLRELVLELAVQGKLSSPMPGDAPVADLCKALSSESAKANGSAGRRNKAMAGNASAHNRPILTPDHWQWVPLNQIGKLSGGMTPSKAKSTYWDGEVNWFSSRDIKTDELFDSGLKITPEAVTSTGLQLYPPGCLFMVARSGILKRTFPVSINRVEACANQDLKVLSPYVSGIDRYLQIMFRGLTSFILSSLVKTGMTVQSLKYEEFEEQAFPLPPLAEQKRIVAKVDELMALCDRLEAQQQERERQEAELGRAALGRFGEEPSLVNLRYMFHSSYAISPTELRKLLLTLAVRGELVRFDREHDGRTVGDHIEFQNGYAFRSEWFKSAGVRVCRNANVSHGILDWRESAFVDERIAVEFERFALTEGDIVLSLDRPIITTGLKVARIRKGDLPCLLLQRVAKPVPKHDQIDMTYFLLWLNSSEFVDSIDPGRSNGVPHISTRQVQSLPLVLPPLAEQRRIVAKVDQLMALVDQLEVQIAESRGTGAKLLDALMAELTAHA